ncbi:MAG: hypothetical protein MZU79_00835 [Anaerotruncus sp.]|nr:hypothetical protein [Anaerotruncus sp.]
MIRRRFDCGPTAATEITSCGSNRLAPCTSTSTTLNSGEYNAAAMHPPAPSTTSRAMIRAVRRLRRAYRSACRSADDPRGKLVRLKPRPPGARRGRATAWQYPCLPLAGRAPAPCRPSRRDRPGP